MERAHQGNASPKRAARNGIGLRNEQQNHGALLEAADAAARKGVLMALAWHADDFGMAYPGFTTLIRRPA
jgi:hypothetical protein